MPGDDQPTGGRVLTLAFQVTIRSNLSIREVRDTVGDELAREFHTWADHYSSTPEDRERWVTFVALTGPVISVGHVDPEELDHTLATPDEERESVERTYWDSKDRHPSAPEYEPDQDEWKHGSIPWDKERERRNPDD